MDNHDPTIEALNKLADLPESVVALIEAYKKSGLADLDSTWKTVIQKTIDED